MVILEHVGVGKGAADLEHLRSLYWRGRRGLTDCPTSLPTSVRRCARTKYTRMHARVR